MTTRMARVRARSARARLALAACGLWLAGVEVLPALHEAAHDRLAPHHHAHGAIITVSFEDSTHRHPDGSIHTVVPRAAREPAPYGPVHATSGPGHAGEPRRTSSGDRTDGAAHATSGPEHAGGLAHHAVGLLPPAPPITSPLPIDRRPITLATERSVELVTRDPLAPNARGPPLVA